MVDEKLIRHISKLSKISLTDEETTDMAQHMERMLEFVDMLRQEAGEGAELHGQPITIEDLRLDIVQPSLDREAALAIAPDASDQGYLVPQIIE